MSDFAPTITLVHRDSRGELYSIALPDNRELMLLHSKKGTLRGGHSHSVKESVMVLTGKMKYHKMSSVPGSRLGNAGKRKDEYVVTLGEGQASPNVAGRVHMGEFVTDVWLIEFKHAEVGAWTQENYPPWRELVEANIRDFKE